MKLSRKSEHVVEYVSNLNYGNFLENSDRIIDSVNTIVTVSDIPIAELSRLTRLHRHTLRKILRKRGDGRLRTLVKLNNFVLKILLANEKDSDKFSEKRAGKLVIKDSGNHMY